MAAAREGFLTDEQREVLKTATQSTEVLSSSPKSPSWLMAEHQIKAPAGERAPNVGIAVRHVRRSHSGKLVRVKKDGGGGKGTWGKLLDTDGEPHIDRNDPNYDSGEEPYQLVGSAVSDPLDEYKRKVASIIDEYFTTGDVDLAASELRDLGSSEYHPYFIKRLVSMAMDRHDKEKEMASVLLSALYSDVISSTQIKQGFFMLLESADDLAVDILDTVETLALFVARGVVDDILPPAFVTRAKKSLSESSKGFEVLQTAEKSYLSAPHHAELVERRWGGSTHITVEEVKKKISDLLREYVESGDTAEACRCIRQLGVAFFHHEVVKRALILAMENRSAEPLILKLLKEASEEGLISSSQMVKGFSRLRESLDDLALDIPSAKSLFESLVQLAVTDNWLDSSFVNSNGDGPVTEAEDDEKLKRYKEEIVSIIHEYFLSDDIPELIRSLVDLGSPEYNPVFLKKLITLAMDRKNREKEMASVLLSTLHIEIFSTRDIVDGFTLLLESAEDTALDILDASNELALFLARAVIDDVLAPLNLEEIGNRLAPNCNGSETVHVAQSLIAARHAGERLLRCWGGGTGWAVEDAKDKIVKLLEEYETGGVVGEACQCIRDLGMPFFNHEVVKKALVMAMEKKNDRMLDLLQECYSEGLITTNQMTKGFGRVEDGLDDLALDIPDAVDKFKGYQEHAVVRGWLVSV
ncbi:putative programmed cell death protein [Helianthus annuus]|uniref:Programmed cell death protein n=2 Tax=Helianthus annuus TaxID=4232 RepID=A0A9K3IGW4_HELAN|nr:MA3 DOMAIN-CONTAINING TRANSLATION REGULATORY FACTOR 1 [Helianthus annuus]XP_022039383.1 MA3 DOMAIN-CONTAINING TRANSLATION REGULATORY FACTOR 1 [Helianthus annuus]KAF5796663.1 putative programmed cell death protein [Helianthus annuus]KAJ0548312.1 putative programmed cell death protein [Helianthus annuus]